MRYGVSGWKAHRWVAAAHALDTLPHTADALAAGVLGIDKVVELTRLATAETEGELIGWATTVSCGAIRRRGDLLARLEVSEDRDAERDRSLSWWFTEEGRRWNLQAELPAAQGAVVVRALERMATRVPQMPGEDETLDAPARSADALVALCSARVGSDPDPDRATVVVHARLEGLVNGSGGAELEGGPVIHPETVKRLLCNARSRPSSRTNVATWSAWVASRASPRPRWCARSVTATASAAFPGVGHGPSPKRTT